MSDSTNDPNVNESTSTQGVTTEEVKVSGEAVVTKVKELIREGNIRRITIQNEAGKTLLEIPLTFGVVGALLAPQLAALGAVGALIANLSIKIERGQQDAETQETGNQDAGDKDLRLTEVANQEEFS